MTAGFVDGDWKVEGSVFRGRRAGPVPLEFRSAVAGLGVGAAELESDAQLGAAGQLRLHQEPRAARAGGRPAPDHRSASYNLPYANGNWQTTLAWGRNVNQPGNTLDAVLLESAASWHNHTVFARAENAQKDELFAAPSPLAGRVFDVSSVSLGYVYDIPFVDHLKLGLGAVGTVYDLPAAIQPAYGSGPVSYMLFTRLKLE